MIERFIVYNKHGFWLRPLNAVLEKLAHKRVEEGIISYAFENTVLGKMILS